MPHLEISPQRRLWLARRAPAIVVALLLGSTPASIAQAAGGDCVDCYFVPVSWCALVGSPAQASPDVAGDMTTNAVLWRRHERPTDNIFLEQAKISLRSAITRVRDIYPDADLDFPSITGPAVPTGFLPGDMITSNPIPMIYIVEGLRDVIRDCRLAWAREPLRPIPEIESYDHTQPAGIIAINANRLIDASGVVHIMGMSACESTDPAAADCSTTAAKPAPFIIVWDNSYVYPGHPNNALKPPTQPLGDKDLMAGHEFVHALNNRDHVSDPSNLMYEGGLQDADGDGIADNRLLSTVQIDRARALAPRLNGTEIDPPGTFLPNDLVSTWRGDRVDELPVGQPAYLDIDSAEVVLDVGPNDSISFRHRLRDVLPHDTAPDGEVGRFWAVIDVDGDEATTIDAAAAAALGLPDTGFVGADLITRGTVTASSGALSLAAAAWQRDTATSLPVALSSMSISSRLLYTLSITTPVPGVPAGPPTLIDSIVEVELGNAALTIPFALSDQLFDLQMMSTDPSFSGGPPTDLLDGSGAGNGFLLRRPEFPHCFLRYRPMWFFAPSTTVPGDLSTGVDSGRVFIDVDGLLPDQTIHAVLGDREVAGGATDGGGRATVALPLDGTDATGLRLVTVGTDDTALTADCVVSLQPPVSEPLVPIVLRDPTPIQEMFQLCDVVPCPPQLLEVTSPPNGADVGFAIFLPLATLGRTVEAGKVVFSAEEWALGLDFGEPQPEQPEFLLFDFFEQHLLLDGAFVGDDTGEGVLLYFPVLDGLLRQDVESGQEISLTLLNLTNDDWLVEFGRGPAAPSVVVPSPIDAFQSDVLVEFRTPDALGALCDRVNCPPDIVLPVPIPPGADFGFSVLLHSPFNTPAWTPPLFNPGDWTLGVDLGPSSVVPEFELGEFYEEHFVLVGPLVGDDPGEGVALYFPVFNSSLRQGLESGQPFSLTLNNDTGETWGVELGFGPATQTATPTTTPTATPTATPTLTPAPTPTPEPSLWLQLVSGLLGLRVLNKRRRMI